MIEINLRTTKSPDYSTRIPSAGVTFPTKLKDVRGNKPSGPGNTFSHRIFPLFRVSTLYLGVQTHAGFNNHQQGTNTTLFFVGLMEVNSAH